MLEPGALGSAARYIGFGLEFAVIIVASVVLGYHLDRYLGTSPLLILLLTVSGMIGALRRLLWSLKRNSKP